MPTKKKVEVRRAAKPAAKTPVKKSGAVVSTVLGKLSKDAMKARALREELKTKPKAPAAKPAAPKRRAPAPEPEEIEEYEEVEDYEEEEYAEEEELADDAADGDDDDDDDGEDYADDDEEDDDGDPVGDDTADVDDYDVEGGGSDDDDDEYAEDDGDVDGGDDEYEDSDGAEEEEDPEDEELPPPAPVRPARGSSRPTTAPTPVASSSIAKIEKLSSDIVPKVFMRDTANLGQLLADNLAQGGQLAIGDLTRLKVPAAASTQWEIPDPLKDKPSYSEDIVGTVVYFSDMKAYWKNPLGRDGKGGAPPDCKSLDCQTGIGNPGGACLICPFNEFGTADNGEGKACRDLRMLFVLVGNSVLPKLVVVPPTSLKPIRKYMLALLDQDKPYYSVVTRFSLKKERSKNGGIEYSQIVPSLIGTLSERETQFAMIYNEQLRRLAPSVANQITLGDYHDPNAGR